MTIRRTSQNLQLLAFLLLILVLFNQIVAEGVSVNA